MTTKKTTGARIEVRPAKIKGKPTGFRVVVIGKNGEPLSTSEVLTSPANVKKNIMAMCNVVSWVRDSYPWTDIKGIRHMHPHRWVQDLTGKVLDSDGAPITKKKKK